MTVNSAQINRYFDGFGLNGTVTLQPEHKTHAMDCENTVSQYDGGIEKRQGFQTKVNGVGGYGMFDYVYTDYQTNIITELLVAGSSNLYKIETGTLNITYSGSYPRAIATVYVESDEFVFKLIENGAEVLSVSLGQGFEETSSVTLATLATSINGVADFAATVTGTNTISAAFLDITAELSLPPNTLKTISYNYTTQITGFCTFDGLEARLNTDAMSNIIGVSYNGYMVFADGAALKVYDGDCLYLAGLPPPVTPDCEFTANGKLSDSFYYYITYGFIDYQGKVSESAWSDPLSVTAVNSGITLRLKTIEDDSGYNTRHAVVNGAQSSLTHTSGLVTITVENTSDLVAGNYAYFYNSASSVNDYVTYVVDSVTSTTIVVTTEDIVSVTDGLVISNGLVVNVYRQRQSETVRYLIASVPNDPDSSTITYYDDLRSAATGSSDTLSLSLLGQVSFPVSSNNLLVGDVVAIPGVMDDAGTPLSSSSTFTVVGSTSTALTVAFSADMIIPADTVVLLDDLTYPIFLGNLLPTSNVPRRDLPPDADLCAVFNGQLVIAKNQFIYWCDTSESLISNSGLQFNITNYFDNFKRPITALLQSGQNLIIGQDRRIDKYTTSDLIFDPIVRTQISDRIGIVAQSACVTVGARSFVLDRTGVYELDGGVLSFNKPVYTYSATGINTSTAATVQDQLAASTGLGGAISNEVINYFTGYYDFVWKRAVLGYDIQNNYLYVYLPIEPDNMIGWCQSSSILLLYETRNDKWYRWSNINIAGGMALSSGFNLYFCERNYGRTLRINVNKLTRRWDNHGYYDHVNPVYFMYQTKYDYLNVATSTSKKSLKELKVYLIDNLPTDYLHTPTIDITIFKDYVNILHSQLTYEFPDQGNNWGFNWNTVPFQSWRPPFESLFPSPEAGEAFSIKFENNDAGQNCKITGWAVQWKPNITNSMRE
jgi:hypothetical protein